MKPRAAPRTLSAVIGPAASAPVPAPKGDEPRSGESATWRAWARPPAGGIRGFSGGRGGGRRRGGPPPAPTRRVHPVAAHARLALAPLGLARGPDHDRRARPDRPCHLQHGACPPAAGWSPARAVALASDPAGWAARRGLVCLTPTLACRPRAEGAAAGGTLRPREPLNSPFEISDLRPPRPPAAGIQGRGRRRSPSIRSPSASSAAVPGSGTTMSRCGV